MILGLPLLAMQVSSEAAADVAEMKDMLDALHIPVSDIDKVASGVAAGAGTAAAAAPVTVAAGTGFAKKKSRKKGKKKGKADAEAKDDGDDSGEEDAVAGAGASGAPAVGVADGEPVAVVSHWCAWFLPHHRHRPLKFSSAPLYFTV